MMLLFKQLSHSFFQVMLVFWVYFKIQGCYPASHRVEHSFQRGKPVSLNPDHTHFLLVDDGHTGAMRGNGGAVRERSCKVSLLISQTFKYKVSRVSECVYEIRCN